MTDLNNDSWGRIRAKLALQYSVSLEHIDMIINDNFKFLKQRMRDPDDIKAVRFRRFGTFRLKPIYDNPGKEWGYKNYAEIRQKMDEYLAEVIPKRREKRNARKANTEEDSE
jgi:hypothetical protein